MGCVQQAVLEFDEEIQAPWRPRLVPDVGVGAATTTGRSPLAHPSRRSPSRVGVCRPAAPVRTAPRGAEGSRVHASAPAAPALAPASRPRVARRPAAGSPAAVRLRLTRRARRLVVVLALAAGVAVGSWLGPLIGGGGGDLRLAGGSSVVVQPRDTLWSIASAVAEGADVRGVVDEIQELNGLDGAALRPGQVLVLP